MALFLGKVRLRFGSLRARWQCVGARARVRRRPCVGRDIASFAQT